MSGQGKQAQICDYMLPESILRPLEYGAMIYMERGTGEILPVQRTSGSGLWAEKAPIFYSEKHVCKRREITGGHGCSNLGAVLS